MGITLFEFRSTVLSNATGGVPSPRHGAETYAFPKERHRFPGHAMMGTRKRNTTRRCRRVVVKSDVEFRTIVLNEDDACSAKCSTDCVSPLFLSVADGMDLLTNVIPIPETFFSTMRRSVFLFQVLIIAWPGNLCFSLGNAWVSGPCDDGGANEERRPSRR